jgi:hypothetical protein
MMPLVVIAFDGELKFCEINSNITKRPLIFQMVYNLRIFTKDSKLVNFNSPKIGDDLLTRQYESC